MVNGVGLRLPSLRGSWVRIPPPAHLAESDSAKLKGVQKVISGANPATADITNQARTSITG